MVVASIQKEYSQFLRFTDFMGDWHAIQSGLFDKVIVSTEDEDIADVARASGAEMPIC